MAVYYPGNNSGGNYARTGAGQGNRKYDDRSGNRNQRAETVQRPHVALDSGTYVDVAEEVMKGLMRNLLSTSKIRNLLSMISSLYDEVRRDRSEKLDREKQEKIQYIRLHFAYEAGRDSKVKAFVEEADIFNHIKDIGDNKEKFLLFCKYMEALVAYHRFYGGKE